MTFNSFAGEPSGRRGRSWPGGQQWRRASPRRRAAAGVPPDAADSPGSRAKLARLCRGVEPIRPRQHQRADQLLDRPAVGDETTGQVVEQLGMRRARRPSCRSCRRSSTMPRPNRCCQTRLTMTRGVSGFSGLVSHWASSRRPLCVGRNWRRVRNTEQAQETARHDRPELLGLAANANLGVGDLLGVPHANGRCAVHRGSVSATNSAVPVRTAARKRRWLRPAVRTLGEYPSGVPRMAFHSFLALSSFSFSLRELLWRGAAATSPPSRTSIVRVVVVEPAAAHLVPHAGAELGAAEDAGQGVVVALRDRIELVVVAAGATRGEARTDRLTVSICSSTLSMMNRTLNRWLTSFTPSARKPVAMSCSSPLLLAIRRAAGRRRSARG